MRQVSVPWARPGSGFTLLFEALVLSFATAMPMAKVAAMTREHDTRIWRIVEHHVTAARDRLDCTGVRRVGMDETAARKGQDYVSIFADLDARRVLFATEGRSADTVGRFAADLAEHGGDPDKVTDTSSDMSTAFISGISQYLPNATMTFDRYHLAAKLSDAVDAVRRAEVATRPAQAHPLAMAKELGEPLGDATPRPAPADAPLRSVGHRSGAALAGGLPGLLRPAPQLRTRVPPALGYGAKRSRLQPIKDFVTLVEKHWDGVIAWHTEHLSNGLLEGINSLVQAAKARARGYRSKTKMITIVYLTAARLQLPTLTNPTPTYMTSR